MALAISMGAPALARIRTSRADIADLSARVRGMGRMVALLRAVKAGGGKLPMAELRTLCGQLGWAEVATYIQSGNVVFTARGKRAAIEARLEEAIRKHFDMEVPVIVRTAAQWSAY